MIGSFGLIASRYWSVEDSEELEDVVSRDIEPTEQWIEPRLHMVDIGEELWGVQGSSSLSFELTGSFEGRFFE